MKKYRLYVVLALGFLVIAAFWLWLRPEAPVSTPVAQQEQSPSPTPRMLANAQPTPTFTTPPSEKVLKQKVAEGERGQREQEKAFLSAFNTPINFWGKVVDEKGSPVPNATIKLGTADRPWETGSSYERTTDANGLFSITEVKGLSISVHVSKDGYYQTPRSRGQLSYAEPSGNKEPLPTPDNPTVFELRKMGETAPLIYVGTRDCKLTKTGEPIEVDLKTGKQVPAGQGDIRFERWANDQTKNEKGHFDWRFRITVPEGGIIEREDQFAFEAPKEGYQSAVEINMSASLGDKWSYSVEKSYFIKVRGDHYARINATIRAGHTNTPLVLESYLNPTPGSRNLEFDPAKVVKLP